MTKEAYSIATKHNGHINDEPEREKTQVIRLPRTYVQDALDRELNIGHPVAYGKRTIDLEMTREQRNELIDDAHYYIDCAYDFEPEIRPIVRSAKLALPKLEALTY